MALEVSGKYIRITIQHQGERIRFKWPEPANEASIRAARRVQNRIKRDLEDGLFQAVEDYLPGQPSSDAFGPFALRWLRGHSASSATKNEYRKALNRYWLPALAHLPISRMRPADIKQVVASSEFPSAKTKNNALIPLRKILAQAYIDELAVKDLAPFVQSEKHQKPPPDPFSRDEAERIMAHFRGTHWEHYWEFMFHTGLRTGEAIGLNWSAVDLKARTVRVQRSQSKGRSLETTKTRKVRDVILIDRAYEALKRQRRLTQLQGNRVFLTQDGKPYATEKAQRAAFTKALKDLGIRHRPQYNTRASYISWALMDGVNIRRLAVQVGNSPAVIEAHYAKWIETENDRAMFERMNRTTDETTDDAL